MLAQLVCLDRRYQRMNCFNMRELQALLKEKHYPDLINLYEQRLSIGTNLNTRFKLNDISLIDQKSILFLNNKLPAAAFLKVQNFNTDSFSVFNSYMSNITYGFFFFFTSETSIFSAAYISRRFEFF